MTNRKTLTLQLRKLRGLCSAHILGKPDGVGASLRSLSIAPDYLLLAHHGCGACHGEFEIVSVLAVVA